MKTEAPRVMVADVIEAACKITGLHKQSFEGKVRNPHIRRERYAIWYVAANVTRSQMAEVARQTNVDRANVDRGIRRADFLIGAGDANFKALAESIRVEAVARASRRAAVEAQAPKAFWPQANNGRSA